MIAAGLMLFLFLWKRRQESQNVKIGVSEHSEEINRYFEKTIIHDFDKNNSNNHTKFNSPVALIMTVNTESDQKRSKDSKTTVSHQLLVKVGDDPLNLAEEFAVIIWYFDEEEI